MMAGERVMAGERAEGANLGFQVDVILDGEPIRFAYMGLSQLDDGHGMLELHIQEEFAEYVAAAAKSKHLDKAETMDYAGVLIHETMSWLHEWSGDFMSEINERESH